MVLATRTLHVSSPCVQLAFIANPFVNSIIICCLSKAMVRLAQDSFSNGSMKVLYNGDQIVSCMLQSIGKWPEIIVYEVRPVWYP